VFTTLEVADSLAGRMRTIKLWPLTISEVAERNPNNILDWAISKSPDLSGLGAADKLNRADYIDLIHRPHPSRRLP